MKIKDLVFDVWLAFGVLGLAVGMLIPVAGILYVLWGVVFN